MTLDSRFVRAFCAVPIFCAATWNYGYAQDRAVIPDAEIERALNGELWEAQAVDANSIDVAVEGGIVILAGTVAHILAKDRAIRIARMTRGVISVVDRLTVQEGNRSDAMIADDVERALATDPATDSWDIHVAVADGVVTLTGTVDSYAEEVLAERVAKAVSGVRRVDNHIDTKAVAGRSDEELKTEIEQLLAWDARLDDESITVQVMDGHVILTGSVGSAFERELAATRARIAVVKSVDTNALEVQWWQRDAQRASPTSDRTDDEIRRAIERTLALDPRVSAFDLEVRVEDGAATLTGIVDNPKAKRAAEQAAHNTVGVWRVHNHLKTRPTPRPADDIVADIQAAFARDPLVTATDVSVRVSNGQARLYGVADSLFERDHIEDIATRVNGVVDVQNYLDVAYDAPHSYDYGDWDASLYDYDFDRATVYEKSDSQIAADIESELFWSPYVDAENIEVRVDNGVATLIGRVEDLHEWRKATENALEGGAFRVHNELEIRPN